MGMRRLEAVSKSKEALIAPDLELIIAQQVNRLIQLGFHKELGMSKEEYRAGFTLPAGASQPESYKGRFDALLVVEPRIVLARQHARAGIKEWINTDNIQNLTKFPDTPYAVWTHDGQKYRPFSVEKAIKRFATDEVGSPQIEVTALYLQHPEYFKNRGVDAAGSRGGGGGVPGLDTFVGGPGVRAPWIDRPGQGWGAGSRGKEIIRLGV